MKKVFITILAFLYLGLASGVVMNLHYCMGQLSSVEYGYDEHDQCGECGMKEKDGCCNTEFKVVKLQDSHQWAKSGSILKKSFALFSEYTHQVTFSLSRYYREISTLYHSPPDLRSNEVYVYTGIFLI